jgi:hypothetical protein
MASSTENAMSSFIDLKEMLGSPSCPLHEKIKGIKEVSKHFYTNKEEDARKYLTKTLDYYEVCVWGHIHNLDKDKSVKALKKYETVLAEELDKIMFENQRIFMIERNGDTRTHKIGNEEAFRQMCESTQLTINQLKIMISLL